MMNDETIAELRRENLCTYYILPLLKLNKFRFIGEGNFVNSFLSRCTRYIYVEVLEILFLAKAMEHPDFDGFWKSGDRYFVRLQISPVWNVDVTRFLYGEFSRMSKQARYRIRIYSGLRYNEVTKPGIVTTDIRLMALERSPALRELWEDYFNITPGNKLRLSPDDELMSIPGGEIYLDKKLTKVGTFV